MWYNMGLVRACSVLALGYPEGVPFNYLVKFEQNLLIAACIVASASNANGFGKTNNRTLMSIFVRGKQ